MLFYSTIEELNYVPTNYLIINVSKFRRLLTDNCNIETLGELLPDFNITADKKKNKKYYYSQLKENLIHIIFIMYGLKLKKEDVNVKGTHIIIVGSKMEIEQYGFNYPKLICKFIELRYGYPYYKYTTDITLDMINNSYLKKEENYEYDLLKNYDKIQGLINE